jgi:putative toxin-antitoxin system antitoxin component (TIGR02293 family)
MGHLALIFRHMANLKKKKGVSRPPAKKAAKKTWGSKQVLAKTPEKPKRVISQVDRPKRRPSPRPSPMVGRAVAKSQRLRDLRALSKAGVSKDRFNELVSALGIQAVDLGRVVSIPQRTLSRRKDNFTPEESDRILQVEATVAFAQNVLGTPGRAREWMIRPHRLLEGKTPLEYCDTSFGVREVNNLLGRLEHAVYA